MKKQLLMGLVVAALPMSALAANTSKDMDPMSEPIQVVKVAQDASAVTTDAITGISNAAETKDDRETTKAISKAVSKSLAYRVSSTATPEVNRMIREEMGQTVRRVQGVSVPGADAYEARKEVGVAPATITLDHMDLTYPVITSVSPVVQKKINDSLYGYVRDLKKNLEKDNLTAEDKQNLVMYYDIKTNSKGILSILVHTYTIFDHGTSGNYYVKGITYNTTTGRKLSLSDFGGIDTAKINQIVADQPELRSQFKEDFPGFASRPEEFYANADTSVVMIGQPSSINKNDKEIVEIPVGILRVEKKKK